MTDSPEVALIRGRADLRPVSQGTADQAQDDVRTLLDAYDERGREIEQWSGQARYNADTCARLEAKYKPRIAELEAQLERYRNPEYSTMDCDPDWITER